MEEEKRPLAPIMTYFSVIQDPRIERNKLYPLEEVIAMAQGREDIEGYALVKETWLRTRAEIT